MPEKELDAGERIGPGASGRDGTGQFARMVCGGKRFRRCCLGRRRMSGLARSGSVGRVLGFGAF